SPIPAGQRAVGALTRGQNARVDPVKREHDEYSEVLFGLHAVVAALEAGQRTIDRVFVARESGGHNLGRLLRAARAAGVPVTHLPREILARKTGSRAVHQGVAALVAPVAYADVD